MALARSELGDCRYYENKFPQTDDLVMVVIKRIADMGAYVSLLEYDDIEGMILMSELSKRRFRSVGKLVKVGQHQVAMVMRTDEKKGYIDLSKRRVSPEDIVKCEERYSKSKAVQTIIRHLASVNQCTVESLNEKITWPLAKKFGHEFEAFKQAASDPDAVLDLLPEPLDSKMKDELVADIKRRLTPQSLKLRAKIEVSCFAYEGIEAVKSALLKGLESAAKEYEVVIKLIAAPQYVIVASCTDREEGLAEISRVLEVIKEEITSKKGRFEQKGQTQVIGGEDDKRLEDLLREEAGEGGEGEGDSSDEDESEEEDEGMGRVEEGDGPPLPAGQAEDDD
uniref:Eukaryotic translation initiation factor 2 subunit 1 n=1 Tax=Chromera velia CCMP2878 TaxID=1169474 RepID=A0A0G4HBK4_9ALVE|eukprot:Cvel_25968.t1-p1 / transcript=Cvel_25968.t1 / gene=Cvel_25968 / organism=Chromera_velia_CCMP2878 / gene_product=Eukaryotic translation initiation factor 2 subunit, putative / transcript_product=Eukaryotic translation initiation factor 2 subunit, putative / location=Cvel_scaffold3013:16548-20733(-) / protein_length=337 / sequence_SO=supercontig / SO=protein_coding / is_pseudo=false